MTIHTRGRASDSQTSRRIEKTGTGFIERTGTSQISKFPIGKIKHAIAAFALSILVSMPAFAVGGTGTGKIGGTGTGRDFIKNPGRLAMSAGSDGNLQVTWHAPTSSGTTMLFGSGSIENGYAVVQLSAFEPSKIGGTGTGRKIGGTGTGRKVGGTGTGKIGGTGTGLRDWGAIEIVVNCSSVVAVATASGKGGAQYTIEASHESIGITGPAELLGKAAALSCAAGSK